MLFLFLFHLVNSIPYSGGSSKNSRFQMFHLFFSQSSKLSQVYHHEAPSKSSQGFTLCFQLLFLFIILFITRVLRGSSIWCFVKDSFHYSIVRQDFSRSDDPPSYTSSILHLAFRSAILSILSFEVVLCHC